MAVVNTCPYCNGSMSSDLIWCPHCEKIYPRNVTCNICFQAMNNVEAIVNKKKSVVKAYYHPSCYREVLKEQKCPTCSYTFSEEGQNSFGKGDQILGTRCSNCGQGGITFFFCACEMKGFIGKEARIKYRNGEEGGLFHRTCVKARQIIAEREWREHEQLLAHRKRSRLCLSCGKKISYLEKWLNGGKCNWDASDSPDY